MVRAHIFKYDLNACSWPDGSDFLPGAHSNTSLVIITTLATTKQCRDATGKLVDYVAVPSSASMLVIALIMLLH